jgi:hypothetical protein
MTRQTRRPRAARRLFGSDPAADVRDELQFHLDAKVDELIERGWQPDEARREAERQDDRRPAGARPRIHRRRCTDRRAAGGDAVACVMDASVRRQHLHRWSDDRAERHVDHRS